MGFRAKTEQQSSEALRCICSEYNYLLNLLLAAQSQLLAPLVVDGNSSLLSVLPNLLRVAVKRKVLLSPIVHV